MEDYTTLVEKVGILTGRVSAMESRADRFEASVHSIADTMMKKLDALQATINSGQGGLKVVHYVASAIAAAAAAVLGSHFHIGL